MISRHDGKSPRKNRNGNHSSTSDSTSSRNDSSRNMGRNQQQQKLHPSRHHPYQKKRKNGNLRFKVCCEEGCEVNQVKEDKKKELTIDKRLPQHPFLLTCIAQRASGKTNMVIDMILDDKKYCKFFDLIYIWSTSYHHDSKWKNIHMPCPKAQVNERYSLPEIESLFKTLQEIAKTKVVNTLFIFDDMIDQNVMHPQHMGILEGVAVRGRHYNISIIIISQLYMKLSNPIRVNSTNMAIFRIRNRRELEKITCENQDSLTTKEFLEVYNYATGEPYAFLHINNQESDTSNKFRKNWNTIISTPTNDYSSIPDKIEGSAISEQK